MYFQGGAVDGVGSMKVHSRRRQLAPPGFISIVSEHRWALILLALFERNQVGLSLA